MGMVEAGTALCVPGNHDMKLLQKLRGKDVKMAHGLADSVAQLETEPPEFKSKVAEFLDGLISHYVLDEGKLVVAHAGMKEEMQGRGSGAIRSFALFGETTGETDEFGLPVRYNWAADYRGKAMVVYGHTPIAEPQWLNRTVNIDTGCVFGGKLTALRYPEKEFLSVPALRTYYEPAKPLASAEPTTALSQQHEQDDVLDIDDVFGKRIVETRLHGNLTIREENAIAALEVMSRFASNPKWLIYLPPTMSPSETTKQAGLLEHPAEAFAYYRKEHVEKVICEQKHMGSRAVVIVCRDRDAALLRFGVVLQRQRLGERIPRSRAGSGNEVRSMGRACERLGVSRLRIDAVVVEGAGLAAPAVRSDRSGCSRWTHSLDSCLADDQQACARSLRTSGAIRRTPGDGRAIRRGIPPLLLDCSLIGRFEARAFSSACERRGGACR